MAKTERKLPSCWQPVLVAKLLPDQNFIKGVNIQGAWLSIIISVPTSQRHKVFSLYGSSTQESRFLSPANSYQDNYHITSEAYCIFFFFCQSPLVLGSPVHVKGFLLCCFYIPKCWWWEHFLIFYSDRLSRS